MSLIQNSCAARRLCTAAYALILLSGLPVAAAQSRSALPINMQDVGATGISTEDTSGRITDTLNVYNHSAVGWYAPEVKATLPAGVHFIVVDRKTDACTAVGRVVTCGVGTLRVMQSVTIKVVLQATDPKATVRRTYTVYPLDTDAHREDNTVTLTNPGPSIANGSERSADPLMY